MAYITQLACRTISRPLRMLFATSLGAKTVATSVLVKVALDDGSLGVGEVPTSFVFPNETPSAIKGVLAQTRRLLVGTDMAEYLRQVELFRRYFPDFHMTISGLEVALFRADLASRGQTEFEYWGGKRDRIETDITIPFMPDGDMLEVWLAKAIKLGFGIYKVKVSGDVCADMAFVKRVLARLGEKLARFTIRLDGNQGYTARSYLRMLDRLGRARIQFELFEQPLRRDDYRGLAEIRGKSPVPVILDETVLCVDDCRRVIDQRLGEGVNIKIAKSGISQSAEILKLARRAGLKLMIGCMTETMVGLSAGICLAGGAGAFDYIDLDSAHLMYRPGRRPDIIADGATFRLRA